MRCRGDTPTGRRVLFDGRELRDEQCFSLGNRLVAQLTQNMNFVMDSPVEDLLRLHTRSRMMPEADAVIARCLETANALSGEPFEKDTRLTRLSGGQARALMIADAISETLRLPFTSVRRTSHVKRGWFVMTSLNMSSKSSRNTPLGLKHSLRMFSTEESDGLTSSR